MFDWLKVQIQYVLPKRRLTALAGRLARGQGGLATTCMIRWFIARYGIDMNEAANPDIGSYKSFNDFFARPLKAGIRPISSSDFVCPVDGAISEVGPIRDDHILQAKAHPFSITELVGGDVALADQFRSGSYANLYLSPKDYHRLHMPCDGSLERMIYIPGSLFAVNPPTARVIPNLFARNERIVCLFTSKDHGPFVMVLVGATIVASMSTVWHGVVNLTRDGNLSEWNYTDNAIFLKKGEEMGRFLLGSTVVILFSRNSITFNKNWTAERPVRLGEPMGTRPE